MSCLHRGKDKGNRIWQICAPKVAQGIWSSSVLSISLATKGAQELSTCKTGHIS